MNLASFLGELPSMIFTVAGKGALISCSALGLAAALRRASAASRHLVLALAVAALLVLPLITVMLPSWNLAVPGVARGSLGMNAAAAGDVSRGVSPAGRISHGQTNVLPLLLWAAVSLLLLIRLGIAVSGLSRLRAGSRPAPPAWQELFDQHRRRLGIVRPVRLGISGSVTVPVTFGWRRPLVLVPEAASDWAEEPLREALVHELSHVRRGDWPIQMIARAACAVHWLDPFVWLLCRRLLLEAELACDDQVLRAGAGAEGYAERLVALARQVRGSSCPPASAVAFARPSELASRVAAILDSGRRRGGPGRLAMAGASAAALLLLLLLAPARLVRAEPERPHAVRQGVEKARAALAEPDSIREGIEGAVVPTGEVLEEAVEQGVSGALDDAAIRGGAREGVNEDSIQDGAREGVEEGQREALEAGETEAAGFPGQSGGSPGTVAAGTSRPLTGASREYAERLHRILTGSFFEPAVPGKGC
jgi:beta-lactamase regulating signal transducer with metallopeptidase domain